MNTPDKFIRDLMKVGYKPTIINRDVNGSLNIRLKGMRILENLRDPEYMARKTYVDQNKST